MKYSSNYYFTKNNKKDCFLIIYIKDFFSLYLSL